MRLPSIRLLGNPTARAALSLAALSAWLVLLFSGSVEWFGGALAVHLLFVASLALFPWRALGAGAGGAQDTAPAPEDERP
ncbi:MAG TPA: hypothetical protein VM599_10035 [Thermoanaerobaculia bacterium]|nr:hypothetical protein [Thermoanaerobaculia bacterium]